MMQYKLPSETNINGHAEEYSFGLPIGCCMRCEHWYKGRCSTGPCATEETDADFYCSNFKQDAKQGLSKRCDKEREEMRLIDANKVEIGFGELCQSQYFRNNAEARHGAETLMCLCVRSDSHKTNTIDPETLPVVQQLREELRKVKAERDAAAKSCAELAEYELTVCEGFCYGDAQHSILPCEWLIGGKCAIREWVKAIG